jgi:hypothetical protein
LTKLLEDNVERPSSRHPRRAAQKAIDKLTHKKEADVVTRQDRRAKVAGKQMNKKAEQNNSQNSQADTSVATRSQIKTPMKNLEKVTPAKAEILDNESGKN